MKKIFVIGQREFWMAVTERTFLFSLIIYPLLIIGINRIRYYGMEEIDTTTSRTIGVVDRPGIIDFGLADAACNSEPVLRYEGAPGGCKYGFQSYAGLESAISDLRDGKLHMVFVVPPAYPESGLAEVYISERATRKNAFGEEPTIFQSLLRASALRSKLEPDQIKRLLTPTTLNVSAVTEKGEVSAARSPEERRKSAAVPITFAIMLSIWITFSARFMLTATLEERANRAMEVMLSSVKSSELLWGKLIGLGCVALLQVTLLMMILNLFRTTPFSGSEVSTSVITLCAAFCLFGYLFFAGLMTGAGVIGWGKAAGFLTMTVWIPMVIWDVISEDPNGSAARLLSYFPATATIAMVVRLNLAPVPLIDIVGSLSLLIASSLLAIASGSKIFRTVALMYGKRIRLPELVRWLREA